MSLTSDVNKIMRKMHSKVAIEKGTFGELAVFKICEEFYNKGAGILVHSYTYKTVSGLAGNIKKEGSRFYVENTGSFTEIDILLVTKFRVFPIEVKAYKARKIVLDNESIKGCSITNKSPVHQNEMHMRHLYPHIFSALPEGSVEYIKPIVVFVDNATIEDKRSVEQKKYIYVTILNNLRSLIRNMNTPLNYQIPLDVMEKKIRNCMVKNEKFLPYLKR